MYRIVYLSVYCSCMDFLLSVEQSVDSQAETEVPTATVQVFIVQK